MFSAKLRDTIRDLRSKDFLFDAPKDAAPPLDPAAT